MPEERPPSLHNILPQNSIIFHIPYLATLSHLATNSSKCRLLRNLILIDEDLVSNLRECAAERTKNETDG